MSQGIIATLSSQFFTRLRREGVGTTVYKAVRYLVGIGGSNPRQDEFDMKRGIYTRRSEPIWMLGIPAPRRTSARHYEAIDPQVLHNALTSIKLDRSSSTFLDLGCGKGRALIIAAELGFRRVLGVDLSTKLVFQARKNLKTLRLRNVTVSQGDACAFRFDIPNCVLYMFNPFDKTVMDHIADNIVAGSHPPAYIIYANPFCAETIERLNRYELVIENVNLKVWVLRS